MNAKGEVLLTIMASLAQQESQSLSQEIVLTALNELLGDKSRYQKQLQQNNAAVIRASAAITTDGID